MVNFCQKLQKMVIFDKKKIIQKLVFLGQFNGFFVNLIFFKEKNIKNCQFLSNNNNFKKITKNGNFLSKKCIFFCQKWQFLLSKMVFFVVKNCSFCCQIF